MASDAKKSRLRAGDGIEMLVMSVGLAPDETYDATVLELLRASSLMPKCPKASSNFR
jgi:hypothetical protein